MKISELKILIKAAEDLGHGDAILVIDDSRDGQKAFRNATARLVKKGDEREPIVMLAVR